MFSVIYCRNFSHMEKTPLLTVNEVAERLSVHRRTVERLIKSGEIKAVRLGYRTVRIEIGSVDAYLDRHAA